VLRLEALHAIEVEQSETIEDVLRRRLELEALPSHGVEALSEVKALLTLHKSPELVESQAERWLEHIKKVDELLR
jgi:glycerol-3-phosphate dehydrogenase